MNAILVDDEKANRENLSQLLSRHCREVTIIGEADGVEDALEIISQLQPELVFLDIQLKDQSGFDLLRQLKNISFEIIFVTAYDQYGIHAVKFAALDYLLKPIDILELKSAVEKALAKIALKKRNEKLDHLLDFLKAGPGHSPKIALPLLNETSYVAVNEIIRCEADNTYTFFYLASGQKILVSRILKEYAGILSPYGFVRVHQSHLVNIHFVKSWLKEDGGMLLLNDNTKIPVSRPNRDNVKEILNRQF